jgi:hypothetical protein
MELDGSLMVWLVVWLVSWFARWLHGWFFLSLICWLGVRCKVGWLFRLVSLLEDDR